VTISNYTVHSKIYKWPQQSQWGVSSVVMEAVEVRVSSRDPASARSREFGEVEPLVESSR
jgi:hypothetical protein